ncbi:MAG: folate family ECF transporter S component [Lachnospiraceae bacterium]|nr:folate family ECF transporter S component [Lachnospiraceae bacterium]
MSKTIMSKGSLQRLTISAMMLAISVILGLFKIPLSQVSEIRLQFLPIAVEGMLFGPLYGGIAGALSDILCYIVRPTGPFFPGFTISAAIQGMIYGLMLYKSSSMPRIILAQVIDCIIVSLLLNPIWLMLLYGNAFIPMFIGRLPKVLIMFPINTVLLAAVIKPGRTLIRERLT